jgi:hypothetical protein
MIVKVMQDSGVVNYSDIAEGIDYALANGAKVINLSLGGYADSITLNNKIKTAALEAVIVAGAGNDNRTDAFYPAAYPDVLAVAGTDQADAKAGFSNYGDWVDVAAPAVSIQTTFAGNNAYGAESGTSLAAPLAAGTAAMVIGQHPDWSTTMVRQHLSLTADPLPVPNGVGGRLNAGRAVTSPARPSLALQSSALDGKPGARPAPGESSSLTLTIQNLWLPGRSLAGTLSSSDPYVTIGDKTGEFGDLNTGQAGENNADPFRISLAQSTPYGRSLAFNLHVTGSEGYVFDLPFSLVVRSSVENVNYNILADTTWQNDKTYILTRNMYVGTGVKLTIQPGTVIKANPGIWMRVDGELSAVGTEEQPIIFSTNSITGTQWGGLKFSASSVPAAYDASGNYISGSILQYVHVSHAKTGVELSTQAPYIVDSLFENNFDPADQWNMMEGRAINTGSSNARIERCTFRNNKDAIYAGSGSPLISHSLFTHHTGQVIAGGESPQILDNTIEDNEGEAISIGGKAVVIRNNRVLNNDAGVMVGTSMGSMAPGEKAVIEHNLIANNGIENTGWNAGLVVGVPYGDATVHPVIQYNTLINNSGGGLRIYGDYNSGTMRIANNNWIGNGEYDVYMSAPNGLTLDVSGNYWGDLSLNQVGNRVYDCNNTDDGCSPPTATIGNVIWQNPLDDPVQAAPAFVTGASVIPQPVGFERGVFDVTFSSRMDIATLPILTFHDARKRSVQTIKDIKDPILFLIEDAQSRIWAVLAPPAIGPKGVYRYDGQTWQLLNKSNSGLADNNIYAAYASSDGDVWFSHPDKISRLHGEQWITYPMQGIYNSFKDIAQDPTGKMWFTSTTQVWALNPGGTWTDYTQPSGMTNEGSEIFVEVDARGNVWVANHHGVSVFDGQSWKVYKKGNELPAAPNLLYADSQGRVWVSMSVEGYDPNAFYFGMFDGEQWHIFDKNNMGGLLNTHVSRFLEDPDGNIWAISFASMTDPYRPLVFDGISWSRLSPALPDTPCGHSINGLFDRRGNLWTIDSMATGVICVIWGGEDYTVLDNAAWVSPTVFRATYDFTPLVPQGMYELEVRGAVDMSGMEIAPGSGGEFEVASAGFVSDNTPPSKPAVRLVYDGSLTTLGLNWSSSDPQGIYQYRYALGTTPGGMDLLDWRYTTSTSASLTGLLFTPGQTYYASVAAQNTSGLWSPVGTVKFTGGQKPSADLYLPLLSRK